MSQSFSIRYRLLDVKDNPVFSGESKTYKDNLRAWYNYQYGLNGRPPEVRIPTVKFPNKVLTGLFRNDDVDTKLGNYLADILEKNAGKAILAEIAADHVKKAIRHIDDINQSKKVMLTIGALWGPIQLRAVTEVLKMGMVNSRNDRILYKEWFNGCVVPALRASHYNNSQAFSRQDV